MKCPGCGRYTMKEECCVKTINPKPAKYSIDDRYGGYRRKARKDDLIKRGLL
jgi:H/ACA ribonucleoprotein complex subunit 3